MKRDLVLALTAFVTLFVIAFAAGILGGLGEAESKHAADSVLLYVRRGLMVLFAVILPMATGKKGLTGYGWKISFRWIVISVVLGIFMGYGNPGGFDPRHGSAIVLACFHAFATELFFRAYLITTLSRTFRGFWLPVVISALAYGVFYLTVWTTWLQPGASKLVFVGLFTCLGLVFGACYKKSGSFLVPWLMHFLGVLQYRMFF